MNSRIFIGLLKYLAEKDEVSRAVAFAIAENFNKLPENERNELLLNLSNIKSAQKIVVKTLKL